VVISDPQLLSVPAIGRIPQQFFRCRAVSHRRNPRCKTSTIVLPEHRVFNAVTSAVTPETERRVTAIAGQLGLALEDEVITDQ
jgi:hypothetical protein